MAFEALLHALLIQELFQSLLPSVLRIAELRLVELGVEIVLALFPSRFRAAKSMQSDPLVKWQIL